MCIKRIIIIGIINLFILTANKAFATTGGPQYFHDFYFDAQNQEIRFLNENPRGCLPELYKYSVKKNQISVVQSCDQYLSEFAEYQKHGDRNQFETQKINDIQSILRKNASLLYEVDLKEAGISFDVKFEKGDIRGKDGPITHYYGGDFIKYKINIKNNKGDILNSKTIDICMYSPVYVTGFTDSRSSFLLILISGINQCFEYGYNGDEILLIDNISIPEKAFFRNEPIRNIEKFYKHNESYDNKIGRYASSIRYMPEYDEVAKLLNTAGMQAYNLGDYQSARTYFEDAYSEDYLLPLFNLAATEAKIGENIASLIHIEELLNLSKKNNEKNLYIKKIIKDPDFDSIRSEPEYQEFFPVQSSNITYSSENNGLGKKIISMIEKFFQLMTELKSNYKIIKPQEIEERNSNKLLRTLKKIDLAIIKKEIIDHEYCRTEEDSRFKLFFFGDNVEGEKIPSQLLIRDKISKQYYVMDGVWDAAYDYKNNYLFVGIRYALDLNKIEESKKMLASNLGVTSEELDRHSWEANNMCGGCPTYTRLARIDLKDLSVKDTGYFGGEEIKINNNVFFTQYTNNDSFKEIYNCWVGIFSSSKDCDHLNIPAFEMDLKTQKINKKFTTKKIGEIKNIKQGFSSCDVEDLKK